MTKHGNMRSPKMLLLAQQTTRYGMTAADADDLCGDCFLFSLASFAVSQLMLRQEIALTDGVDSGELAGLLAALMNEAVWLTDVLQKHGVKSTLDKLN